jgi:hypothetical protein
LNQIVFLIALLTMLVRSAAYASEIDYSNCGSIQEVIERETQEIAVTNPANHDELAQLYVSRGESYLLNAQYELATQDFLSSNSQIGYCRDMKAAMFIAFRAAFGEAICYDNLGMAEETEQALNQLKIIAIHIDCSEPCSCPERDIRSAITLHFQDLIKPVIDKTHFSQMVVPCKSKKGSQPSQEGSYDDILGPDQAPDSDWCEEVVVGVGRAMDAIACLAPNNGVKVALIGVIEALITRGVKCCQAGGFWKACVAPISRKWREWKNNKEKNVFPDPNSLPLYIN